MDKLINAVKIKLLFIISYLQNKLIHWESLLKQEDVEYLKTDKCITYLGIDNAELMILKSIKSKGLKEWVKEKAIELKIVYDAAMELDERSEKPFKTFCSMLYSHYRNTYKSSKGSEYKKMSANQLIGDSQAHLLKAHKSNVRVEKASEILSAAVHTYLAYDIALHGNSDKKDE